jgi:hypothetical protein
VDLLRQFTAAEVRVWKQPVRSTDIEREKDRLATTNISRESIHAAATLSTAQTVRESEEISFNSNRSPCFLGCGCYCC